MSAQNTVISFEQLVRDFDSLFQHRVFRLETLDWYVAPNEREPYARFLAGERVDPAWREPWKKIVRGVRESGRVMQRVHVVTEPVSDYIRFELLHAYPANVQAGEDVRILGRGQAGSLPDMDFWLFDDSTAAKLTYNRAGGVLQVELERDPGMLRWYLEDRDRALRLATPLARYVAEHNITSERTQAA
jgi:Family of unknown function (DUF6879)